MGDIATRIRDYYESAAEPVSVDEITTLESTQDRPSRDGSRRRGLGWVYAIGAATAVVVLVGGMAWLTRTTGSDTPGADTFHPTLEAPDTAAQGEDAAVSVTGEYLGHYWQPPLSAWRERGVVVPGGRMEMSDQRLSGDVTYTFNGDAWETEGSHQYLYWGTWLIENDGGTWEGTHFAADHHSRPGVHGAIVMQLVGSGDYEGLSAILYRTVISDLGDPIEESVDGMIFPGDLPPDRTWTGGAAPGT